MHFGCYSALQAFFKPHQKIPSSFNQWHSENEEVRILQIFNAQWYWRLIVNFVQSPPKPDGCWPPLEGTVVFSKGYDRLVVYEPVVGVSHFNDFQSNQKPSEGQVFFPRKLTWATSMQIVFLMLMFPLGVIQCWLMFPLDLILLILKTCIVYVVNKEYQRTSHSLSANFRLKNVCDWMLMLHPVFSGDSQKLFLSLRLAEAHGALFLVHLMVDPKVMLKKVFKRLQGQILVSLKKQQKRWGSMVTIQDGDTHFREEFK